jgi:pyridoxal phosphate enzyme (YggS family)
MTRSEELAANLASVQERITRSDVTLIVVTKTYPVSDVQILKELGVENFGENRTEEGEVKAAAVPATWHFQGGIQSRKLKDIVQWADVIHSLDSTEHALKLGQRAVRPMKVFLQLSLDGDPERGGVVESELAALAEVVVAAPNLTLAGLMCVPPVSAIPAEAFSQIYSVHQRFLRDFPNAQSLSTGMSGDFEVAIDHGATHIRVGSSILGSRTYRE